MIMTEQVECGHKKILFMKWASAHGSTIWSAKLSALHDELDLDLVHLCVWWAGDAESLVYSLDTLTFSKQIRIIITIIIYSVCIVFILFSLLSNRANVDNMFETVTIKIVMIIVVIIIIIATCLSECQSTVDSSQAKRSSKTK
jgi:heme/copper-type cytochrome/quinol oxidase subunit 2